MRPVTLPAIAILALLGACSERQPVPPPETTPASAPVEDSPFRYRAPAPVRQNPDTLLTSGRLPLAYLSDTGGAIRVVNVTARQVLVTQTVPPGTLIGVSASGVVVASRKVLAGPLPSGHEYQIWLDAPR